MRKARYLDPIEIDGLAARTDIEALFEADNLAANLGSFAITNIRVAGPAAKVQGYWTSGKDGTFTAQGILRQLTQYNHTARANPKGYQESGYTDRVTLTGSFESTEAGALLLPEGQYADFSLASLRVMLHGPVMSTWDVRVQLPLWQGESD